MQATMRRIREDRYRVQRWPEPAILFRDAYGVQEHRLDIDEDTDDANVHVFRDYRGTTYALILDRDIGYVGLQAFQGEREIGSLFLQYDYEIRDALGTAGLRLSEITIARRLAAHIGRPAVRKRICDTDEAD